MAVKKYYVVWNGLKTGIFDNWNDCKASVTGVNGAKFKSFPTLEMARNAYYNGPEIVNKKPVLKPTTFNTEIITDSLAVDAACSGNPGIMEYRGVFIKTGDVLFHQKHPLGTNNIGEFLAIVHGLAELKKRNLNIPVYTDSKTAMSWIKHKQCKTKLNRNSTTEKLFQIIERAEKWLQTNTFTQKIIKWDTENWGEIPADFGRK
ncbi:MAG: ribonuclease H family protein [Marinilabiliaceae bacterium]|nr:ribonuclease H family protein [Marinilabiliaceae bacterium]